MFLYVYIHQWYVSDRIGTPPEQACTIVSMCICIYLYMYMYIYIYIYICVYVHNSIGYIKHACVYVCVLYVYAYIRPLNEQKLYFFSKESVCLTCVHAYMHIYTHKHKPIYILTHKRTYVLEQGNIHSDCMYTWNTHMYIYIHTYI